VDFYPNKPSLNQDNIEERDDKPDDEDADITKFKQIGENIRVYPDQPTIEFNEGIRDVQELEITMKFPGEDYEKTYTQYYLFDQGYGCSIILLYPCFDNEYCFDIFGNEGKAP